MKKNLYLIDFCNFSHALFSNYWDKDHESRAFRWFSQKAALSNDEFDLYIDGAFRRLGMDRYNLRQIFCQQEKADERIKEYAAYCKQINKRVIVVTNDKALADELRNLDVKVISCLDFNRRIYSKLNKT